MKKIYSTIAFTLLALLIAGACGGGGSSSGWSAEEKSSLSDLYSIAYQGEELDCAVEYTTSHISYNGYMAELAKNMAGGEKNQNQVAALEEACNLD